MNDGQHAWHNLDPIPAKFCQQRIYITVSHYMIQLNTHMKNKIKVNDFVKNLLNFNSFRVCIRLMSIVCLCVLCYNSYLYLNFYYTGNRFFIAFIYSYESYDITYSDFFRLYYTPIQCLHNKNLIDIKILRMNEQTAHFWYIYID